MWPSCLVLCFVQRCLWFPSVSIYHQHIWEFQGLSGSTGTLIRCVISSYGKRHLVITGDGEQQLVAFLKNDLVQLMWGETSPSNQLQKGALLTWDQQIGNATGWVWITLEQKQGRGNTDNLISALLGTSSSSTNSGSLVKLCIDTSAFSDREVTGPLLPWTTAKMYVHPQPPSPVYSTA